MFSNRAPALHVVLAVLPQMVDAADGAAHSVDTSAPRRAVEANHGKWNQLTSRQWQFLRGIYAMDPMTPPGLPCGAGGMVFFIDGDKARTPMAVPGDSIGPEKASIWAIVQ